MSVNKMCVLGFVKTCPIHLKNLNVYLPVSLSKMYEEIVCEVFFDKFHCCDFNEQNLPFTSSHFSALLPLVLSYINIQLLGRKSLERLQFFKTHVPLKWNSRYIYLADSVQSVLILSCASVVTLLAKVRQQELWCQGLSSLSFSRKSDILSRCSCWAET